MSELNEQTEAEVDRLQSMPIVELRALWRAKFKSDPPPAFGPDLLRRSLAHKVQTDAYGWLGTAEARLLKTLVAQYSKTPGKVTLPRRIKAGATLVREWKGERHSVTVLKEGFSYKGTSHESLSEIARLITGTRWNGPRFFGLRDSKEQQA